MTAPLSLKDAGQIRLRYVNYWREVTTVTNGKAVQIRPDNIVIQQGPAPATLVVETPETAAFAMRGLTGRRDDGTRSDYDVYLQFSQTIHRPDPDKKDDLEAVSSNARVVYIQARTSEEVRRELAGEIAKAKSYHGYHFDLRKAGEDFHPLYHVQYDHGCIAMSAIGRKYDCPGHRADVPRIPTPPIDLPQLVYIIANDHFMHKGLARRVREEMLDRIRKAARPLPRLPKHKFPNDISTGALDCAWWYA